MICNEILANSSLETSLVVHFETSHPDHKNKPIDFFKGNIKVVVFLLLLISNAESKTTIDASLPVSYRSVRSRLAHTVVESLIEQFRKYLAQFT